MVDEPSVKLPQASREPEAWLGATGVCQGDLIMDISSTTSIFPNNQVSILYVQGFGQKIIRGYTEGEWGGKWVKLFNNTWSIMTTVMITVVY